MINKNVTSFFLVEEDTKGEQFGLQKSFNGSGFTRAYEVESAFKFQDEDKAKQACKLQNMMNSFFGSDKKTFYSKETIKREMFDENGETATVTEEVNDEQPSDTTAIP